MSSTDRSFVHLHCHTDFSMLDGAARVADLAKATADQGMPAIAMTDHGYLYGAYEFYKSARAQGVKPIVGLEAYLTPKTHRSERKKVRFGDGSGDDVSSAGAYTHMTMWAESTEGMHNLFRLGSRASMEGFFYKPRADRELLHDYAKGLLATTGCPSGEVQTHLRLGQYRQAVESAAEFRDIFGAGNFFVELMDHGLDIERRVRDDLLKLARELDLPVVATNDLHYVHEADADAQDTLLCLNSGSNKDTPNRFKFQGSGYYLKSAAEMRDLFSSLPEACDNTLLIAERCEVEFTEGEGRFMPRFPTPEGETEDTWFEKEVERGLIDRFGGQVPEAARERALYEMEVIRNKGYSGYFLVVSDFIKWAKDNGIRVGPGRGSGAGSMCAYAMRITDLDPIEHGLIFERFLNPERASMPDFDIDFDDRRRSEVIQYVSQKYGDDHVAMIATYGTIKSKAALKDAARVHGYPFAMGEKLTKAMPPAVMAKDIPLSGIFDKSHPRYGEATEFRGLIEADRDAATVFEAAQGIEGLKRQVGVHAAGVIMSSEPLLDIIPIWRRDQDGAIVTQFDYPGCEALGLVKMDFLGLRNLTILDDAVNNVKLNQGVDLDLEALAKDMTDPATYELLGRGDSLGVFQLDGGPLRALMRLMRPDSFEDISALIALYRPGPMGADSHTNYALRKIGRQEVTPIHPELAEPLAEILAESYGLIIYQEQVMEIAQKLAGYSLGTADLLRRAMGKKKKEVLDAEYANFEKGMRDNGYSPGAVKTLWDILLPFSDYAFNKSHSAAYGLVSYWTAYLKANYPAEYMAALLQSVSNDKDKMALYLNECRRMGIQVLPPDINESEALFTPVGNDIRFGLAAVRNVGHNVVQGLVEARTQAGRFSDLRDFMDKVPLPVCNKRVLESLVKAGAFDSLGHTRRGLMAIHEQAADAYIDLKKNQSIGQDSLFAELSGDDSGFEEISVTVPEVAEWDKRTLLANERDMLGLYVSDHPLNGLEHVLSQASDMSLGRLTSEEGPADNSHVTVAALITSVVRKTTKKGDLYAVVGLEDLEGSIEVMVWPSTYQLSSSVLAEDTIVAVKARVKRDDDDVKLFAEEVTVPDVARGTSNAPVVITLPAVRVTPPVVGQLKDVLATHPGVAEVHLKLNSTGRTLTMKLEETLRVTPSPSLMADLKALFGPSCLSA